MYPSESQKPNTVSESPEGRAAREHLREVALPQRAVTHTTVLTLIRCFRHLVLGLRRKVGEGEPQVEDQVR